MTIKIYLTVLFHRRSVRRSVDWNGKDGATVSWGSTSLRSSERGLKSKQADNETVLAGSLRSSERGLKFICTGGTAIPKGRSVRRSVDWNKLTGSSIMYIPRRSVRRSVDWNSICAMRFLAVYSRSVRRSVDWNSTLTRQIRKKGVAPFVGAWIEIYNFWVKFWEM